MQISVTNFLCISSISDFLPEFLPNSIPLCHIKFQSLNPQFIEPTCSVWDLLPVTCPESSSWPRLGQLQISHLMWFLLLLKDPRLVLHIVQCLKMVVLWIFGGIPSWLIFISVFFGHKIEMLPTCGQFTSLLRSLA